MRGAGGEATAKGKTSAPRSSSSPPMDASPRQTVIPTAVCLARAVTPLVSPAAACAGHCCERPPRSTFDKRSNFKLKAMPFLDGSTSVRDEVQPLLLSRPAFRATNPLPHVGVWQPLWAMPKCYAESKPHIRRSSPLEGRRLPEIKRRVGLTRAPCPCTSAAPSCPTSSRASSLL